MKKLQSFGIVSLATMTLGTLTLSQEVKVMAEENPPVEATTVDDQPISDETISNEEASDSPQESDNVVDETAETETQQEEENSQSSEAADETSTESTDTNSDSVNQRFHLQISSDFTFQGYSWYDVKDYYLEKGESLSISDLVGEASPWEIESVILAKESEFEERLTPSSVLSYEDLIKKYPYGTSLRITYKPKDFRPISLKTSQIGEKGENDYLSVRVNHYLVTNEGLALIDSESKGVDHKKPSFSPTYRTDYLNLEPLAGATLMKDFHRIESFTVGDSINFNDMTLKKDATVNLYYQKKGDKVNDYYNKPALDFERRRYQVLHVDENGQNIAEASKDIFFKHSYTIIPGVEVKVPVPELKGYKARQDSVVVSYDDFGSGFNSVRLVYDMVDKEAVEPLELRVAHFVYNDSGYYGSIEYETITLKPGLSVTLSPKSVEGYHTLQDTVTLTYDQVTKSGGQYSFYYRKNAQEWPVKEKEWSFKVIHVLDDGTEPIWQLVEKSELVDNFTLKPGGSPVVPTFKNIEGWVPDPNRSFQEVRHEGRGLGYFFKNYEQGVGHQYGTTPYEYVALVYKKAEVNTGTSATADTQPTSNDSPVKDPNNIEDKKFLKINKVFSIHGSYDVSGENQTIELTLEKGQTLKLKDYLKDYEGWQLSYIGYEKNVYGYYGLPPVTLDKNATLSFEDLERFSSINIVYVPNSHRPDKPGLTSLETATTEKMLEVRHILVTEKGLKSIGDWYSSHNLDSGSVTPEWLVSDKLEAFDATLFKGNKGSERFVLGSSVTNDTRLAKRNVLAIYYKFKGQEPPTAFYDLPYLGEGRRSFNVFYVDENGRDIAAANVNPNPDYHFSPNGYKVKALLPGESVELSAKDIPGYRPRYKTMTVYYDDLGQPYGKYHNGGNTIRMVYDKVSDEGDTALTIKIKHLLLKDNLSLRDFRVEAGADEATVDTITLKPGQSVTVNAKVFDGYKPVTQSLTFNYDDLSKRYLTQEFSLYYTRDGKLPKVLEEEENTVTVNHIFDNGKDKPEVIVETVKLQPGGPAFAPAFKTVDGWEADVMRSSKWQSNYPRVKTRRISSSAGGGYFDNLEEKVSYIYEQEDHLNRVILVYKKVKTEDIKKPLTPDENTPSSEKLLSDTNSGVSVLLGKGEKAPITAVKVSHIETKSENTPRVLTGKDFDLFDIELVDENGKVLAITEPALVSLPIDEGKVVDKILYLPTPETKQELAFTVKELNGRKWVMFNVEHFSHYGIVYLTETGEKPSEDSTDTPSTDQGGNVSDTTQPVDTVPDTPSNTSETEEKPSEDNADKPNTDQGEDVSDTTQPVDTVPSTPSDSSNTSETVEKPSEDSTDTPSTDQGGDVSDTTQPIGIVIDDKIVNNTLLTPHCIGEEFDTVRLELGEKTGEMLVTSIASSESLTKSQTLSRVESRHLPETSDRKNSFVLFGLAILGLLGIHQPNRSRRIRH